MFACGFHVLIEFYLPPPENRGGDVQTKYDRELALQLRDDQRYDQDNSFQERPMNLELSTVLANGYRQYRTILGSTFA